MHRPPAQECGPWKSRKVLFLGQSGSGKSTLTNVVYHSDVSLEKLVWPAPVGNRGRGVTSDMNNYITHDSTVLTDTVGFDDSRFDPMALALELRRIIRASMIGFTHIVLVLPLGRITRETRIYLLMLNRIFGETVWANTLLYISKCEDGSTVEDFKGNNSDDADLAPLCSTLDKWSSDECPRIIAGTLISHRSPERDRNVHLQDRVETLGKLQRFLNTSLPELTPPAGDTLELIFDILERIRRTIFNIKTTIGNVLPELSSTQLEIRTHYPKCPVCASGEYTEENAAAQLLCGHIFHLGCCHEGSVMASLCRPIHQYICSTCSREVPLWDQLPVQPSAENVQQRPGVLTLSPSSPSVGVEVPPEAAPNTTQCISKFRVPPKRQTFGQAVMTLYHVTAAGEEILKSGEMLRGSHGLVGGGIYFADTPATCRAKAETFGYTIEAKVLVGKAKRVELGSLKLGALMNQYTFTSLHSEGYDSLHVVGLRTGDEFIVYNKDQVELISVKHD